MGPRWVKGSFWFKRRKVSVTLSKVYCDKIDFNDRYTVMMQMLRSHSTPHSINIPLRNLTSPAIFSLKKFKGKPRMIYYSKRLQNPHWFWYCTTIGIRSTHPVLHLANVVCKSCLGATGRNTKTSCNHCTWVNENAFFVILFFRAKG